MSLEAGFAVTTDETNILLHNKRGQFLSALKNLEVTKSRETLQDPTHLPTHVEIHTAFNSGRDDDSEAWVDYINDEDNPKFEIITQEYIAALGEYFAKRAKELSHSQTQTMRILEVGAGDGRLSHFLNQYLNQQYPGLAIVLAIDSNEYEIKPVYPVETLDYKKALDEYSPDVVICSWMSPNEDFTADFRLTHSVNEYVLIGEPDVCGKEWETWGFDSHDQESMSTAPFTKDGFSIQRADDMLEELQLCRTDSLYESETNLHSSTISFRRNKP